MTVRQARHLGDMTYHHFATKCSNCETLIALHFFLCLPACLFCNHCLPEVRWKWNGNVSDHSFGKKDDGKIWSPLSFKKGVNSNCPGWLSVTSKINPRKTSCSWDIDCSFLSGAESMWGASAPSLKGKGMRWRSGVMQSHFLL